MQSVKVSDLDHVMVEMTYTKPVTGQARVRAFPPSSGRKMEVPPRERISVPVYDCRPIAEQMTLDEAGFAVLEHHTEFRDFYNPDRVRSEYYPESEALLKSATGALAVFIFDHNVRSKARSDRGDPGVRMPVDGAHNDYTLSSGPRRIREVLEENDALDLIDHRAALINVWRPIMGPVQDQPFAICDARSTTLEDFIPTDIQHFQEGNLNEPSLTGQIYSFKHSDAHRWFYVADMQPDDVILLKCYDTADDGRAVFTGHTGFRNPACPPESKPRESIELRTVVVYR